MTPTYRIDLHLQVPTNMPMRDLQIMLERMAAAANADLKIGRRWPLHVKMTTRSDSLHSLHSLHSMPTSAGP